MPTRREYDLAVENEFARFQREFPELFARRPWWWPLGLLCRRPWWWSWNRRTRAHVLWVAFQCGFCVGSEYEAGQETGPPSALPRPEDPPLADAVDSLFRGRRPG